MHEVPLEKPTMFFIGVTTAGSSSVQAFPRWAEALGLGDVALAGLDFLPHDEPARYRDAVRRIAEDPLARGALVTTHKMDLLKACQDLFDEIDPLASSMREVSSIYKRGGKLLGRTVDPACCGLALDAFLPEDHWREAETAEVCILGAGGSSLALTWHLLTQTSKENRPSKITVTNRSSPRLEHMRAFHATLDAAIPVEYHLCPEPADNDTAINGLPPGSLVVNATGVGKDSPGSPVTDGVSFPSDGYLWEFNYRGDLHFRTQAYAQKPYKHLVFEDGWTYFVHGWLHVIGDVFRVDVPSSGSEFEKLSDMALATRH